MFKYQLLIYNYCKCTMTKNPTVEIHRDVPNEISAYSSKIQNAINFDIS